MVSLKKLLLRDSLSLLVYIKFSVLVYFPKKYERSFCKDADRINNSVDTCRFWAKYDKILFLRTIGLNIFKYKNVSLANKSRDDFLFSSSKSGSSTYDLKKCLTVQKMRCQTVLT